ncbi:cupin domain-containing protein [Segetibacter koreensis]|uniref:cupin domain-containing protein n=1 Tax=Segetibacter koreensis TaxID=398037 RepID=UPI00035FAB51|nr:cupin domain-containing protein [Segetibacter koreensis]
MKKVALFTISFLLVILISAISFVLGRRYQHEYILEHEKDLAKEEPAPHDGVGMSTAYSFFSKAPGLKLAFRKRVLKPGSAIGYHLQKGDEIYYILSGTGIMKMNSDSFAVKAGDGILTRPGSSHGLQQTGTDSLVVIINYTVK